MSLTWNDKSFGQMVSVQNINEFNVSEYQKCFCILSLWSGESHVERDVFFCDNTITE